MAAAAEKASKPATFARMLSWEFSRPSVIAPSKSRRRSSAAEKEEEEEEEESENSNSSSEYYTAEESPTSDDNSITPRAAAAVPLPPSEQKRRRRPSKRQRRRHRLERREFLAPFAEGFDDDATEAVRDALDEDLTTTRARRVVPTLAEICIQAVWGGPSIRREKNIDDESRKKPFFMDRMKLERRAHQSIASVQIKWLHKNLASIQSVNYTYNKSGDKSKRKGNDEKPLGYCDRFLLDSFDSDGYGGLYTPLPHPDPASNEEESLATMAHVLDLTLGPNTSLANIERLRSALKTRYPKLTCNDFDDALPYVWWARGNVTAAAEAFIQRSNAIKEKSVTLCGYYLNEVGRLYAMFGDRQKSAKFFRLASEAVPIFSYQKLNDVSMPDLRDAVSVSSLALSAAAWDCGVLDEPCAVQAAEWWKTVLLSPSIPSLVIQEAFLSRLAVHAGKFADRSKGKETSSSSSLDWLRECADFLQGFVEKSPQLYHYLALTYALRGMPVESKRFHKQYIERHSSFLTWDNGLPGTHRGMDDGTWISNLRNPWQPLITLLEHSPLSILKLKWRTRLTNPMTRLRHPIYGPGNFSPKPLSFHVDSNGYLSIGLVNDFPSLRGLLLDLHTGALSFPYVPHVTNEWFTFQDFSADSEGGAILPVPFVLFERNGKRVEFLQACSNSRNKRHWFKSENSLSILFMTDLATRRRMKVDLRTIIRKKLKEAFLEKATTEFKGDRLLLEEKKSRIEKMFQQGLASTWEEIAEKNGEHLKKANGFHLHMKSFVSYGEATVALMFSALHLNARRRPVLDLVVIVNCQTAHTFKEPKVHFCLNDSDCFEWFYPKNSDNAHPEMKYIALKKGEVAGNPPKATYHLVDENGCFVYETPLSFCFLWGVYLGSVIENKRIRLSIPNSEAELDVIKESAFDIMGISATALTSSALFVLATDGLFVMDPTSLHLFNEEGERPLIEGSFHKMKIMECKGEYVAIALDYFIVLLEIKKMVVSVLCKVELPSCPSEVCLLPGSAGFLITSGLFDESDEVFDEQLFWFNLSGSLKGVLPILGKGPHSFFPLYVRQKEDEERSPPAILNVCFYDGRGGVCCMSLDDDV